ncbi:MAG: hypothetical protein ACYCYM_00925 [Saccharofermentanales bacterium]
MLLSRRIAFSGISVSLILVFITFSFFSPVADFALFSLASLCIALIIVYTGFRTGILAYTAASLLIFSIFGILYAIPFACLFGIFPILKGLIERRFKKIVAYIIKGVYFSTAILIGFLVFSDDIAKLNIFMILPDSLTAADSPGAMFAVILSGIVILFIYDYALTLLIDYFAKRLENVVRK